LHFAARRLVIVSRNDVKPERPMTQPIDLVALFRRNLELCKVQPSETVAVLTEDGERQDYATAFLAAAHALGASTFQLNLPKWSTVAAKAPPGARNQLAGNRAAIEALKSADIVIDLLGLLWSPEQTAITDAGVRMLLVKEPVDILARMFPTDDLRRRCEASRERLAKARTMRITSAAGTDVTYRLGQYRSLDEYGFTDAPGRWDHWPSGFSFTGPSDGGVDGTVVLAPGDIILSSVAVGTKPFRRYVETPIRLTVTGGKIVRIEGDGKDASELAKFMDSFDDPRAYAISHIGWGMNENARWDYLAAGESRERTGGMDARAVYGNVLFSTGPNSEYGGDNNTRCHLDIPMKNCDLSLDNEQILAAGRVVPGDLAATGR
jgi:2,5-dihydroxypyridine 5,6-dioxygenase